MKTILSVIFFFSFFHPASSSAPAEAFDKKVFYKSLMATDIKLVDQQLEGVKLLPTPDRDAFEGALLMKKSGLIKDKKEKLNLFKLGRTKLELSIKTEPQNCEYRFLRLIIQEHCPEILGYKKNMEEDCLLIKNKYPSASAILQKNIREYSINSLFLRLFD